MSDELDALFEGDPEMWLGEVPGYQRESIDFLLKGGKSLDEVAQTVLTASAANTFTFGSATSAGDKAAFLTKLKCEVRAFLCGDKKYSKERAKLFGDKAPTRSLLVSTLAAAMAPHLGMAASILATIIALILASLGKISLNAWCATAELKAAE